MTLKHETSLIKTSIGTIPVKHINKDVNGNARIIIHFTDLQLNSHDKVEGLTKYRGLEHGYYVSQSFDHKITAERMVQLANNHNMRHYEQDWTKEDFDNLHN